MTKKKGSNTTTANFTQIKLDKDTHELLSAASMKREKVRGKHSMVQFVRDAISAFEKGEWK